jgi:hypothetical protein
VKKNNDNSACDKNRKGNEKLIAEEKRTESLRGQKRKKEGQANSVLKETNYSFLHVQFQIIFR